ncbi:hypothetical protein niasHT_024581 [Heterodera trifolii]|uniref:F-box domain-containing protein n=1 Tax=Heterodera trifolii TaxID=157864 RepID=A0ABD2K7G2_9BILA
MEHPSIKWWRILPPELSDELSHFVSDSFCRNILISTNSLFYRLLHLTNRANRWKSEVIDYAEVNTLYRVVVGQRSPPPPPVPQQFHCFRLFRAVLRALHPLRSPLQFLLEFVSPRPQRANISQETALLFQQLLPHSFYPMVPWLSCYRSISAFLFAGLCLKDFSHRISLDDRLVVVTLRARVENGRELVRGYFTQERTDQIGRRFNCGFVFCQLPQVQWDIAVVTFYRTVVNWDGLMLHLYDILTAIEQGTEPPNFTRRRRQKEI